MPHQTALVIIHATDGHATEKKVKEFLSSFLFGTRGDPSVRFIRGGVLPLHGLRTIEFVGFDERDCNKIRQNLHSLKDYHFLDCEDEILVTISPVTAHIL